MSCLGDAVGSLPSLFDLSVDNDVITGLCLSISIPSVRDELTDFSRLIISNAAYRHTLNKILNYNNLLHPINGITKLSDTHSVVHPIISVKTEKNEIALLVFTAYQGISVLTSNNPHLSI